MVIHFNSSFFSNKVTKLYTLKNGSLHIINKYLSKILNIKNGDNSIFAVEAAQAFLPGVSG